MTTKDILNLDYRKEENKVKIQRVLRKIKPLSKYSEECDIPFEALEKAILVMCKKYKLFVGEFAPDKWADEKCMVWRATIINEVNFKAIDIVYGISIYEVFAKVAIRLYAEIMKGINIKN